MLPEVEEQARQDRERLKGLGWIEGLYGWWFHPTCPGVKFTFRAALSLEADHTRRHLKAERSKRLMEECEE
jgi:hypothetical protein